MARLTFPSGEDRLAYGVSAGGLLTAKPGTKVRIYSDSGATTLADIQTVAGAAIANSELTVDSGSQVPLFKGPDAVSTLYVKAVGGSAISTIYPSIADRLSDYAVANKTVPKPPGTSWVPFDVLGMTATGDVAVSKTPQQILDSIVTLPNAATTPVYIDATYGSDAAGGVNPGQPHKTLTPALSLGVYRHFVSVGEYPDVLDLRSNTITGDRVRRFYGAANPVDKPDFLDSSKYTVLRATGDQATALTWATTAGTSVTYSATVPGTNHIARVLINLRRDEYGRSLPLPKQTTALDVNSQGWGWHFDTTSRVLTVRFGTQTLAADFTANVAPKLTIVYRQPANYYARAYGGQVYFENVVFAGVYPWLLADATRPNARMVFKNCVFAYSDTGAVVNDGGRVVLIDCEIYRPNGDGVGSHVAAGFQADHIVINTLSRKVGDIDTFGVAGTQNKNHASMHESGRSAILGLKGRESFGPGLIDTGEAGGTGVSWWYGCDVSDAFGVNSNYETFGVAGGLAGVRTVWMDQCAENGDAASPVAVSSTGTVLRYGINAVRGYTPASGGVVSAYNPANPV